ncbi:DUF7619 domain-containing protein [Flavobacterium solisilvae]|uniref:T9SS type A sorting domain-containing protein n=1 Tax=Flavobacterium solisilvae TaxID=1852019 RepID=A0ABX1QXD4_9FLAO|nr:choice-of-anchor L domain-containing protein [Flavobacterium solisilvae]NMH25494.1 T9SS type A sorting domain-containing protein [Flavobacterium solisilvae]
MKKQLLFLFLLFSSTLFAQFQNQYPDYSLCDDNNDGFEAFDLTLRTAEILNGASPSEYTVAFYETFLDASSGVNSFSQPNSYFNINPNSQMIYIGIKEIATNEISVASMLLNVVPKPQFIVNDAVACNDNGMYHFDLGSIAEDIWGQTTSSPNSLSIGFYLTLTDAQNNTNPLSYTYSTQTNNTVLFISAIDLQHSCSSISTLTLVGEDCAGNTCVPPTNIAVTNITNMTATVNWTSLNGETLWEVMILPMGSNPPLQTTMGIITNANPFVLTNLQCNTDYDVYVRATCGLVESAWSTIPISFTTAICGGVVSVGTSYTPTQLVNDVLLSNACGIASSITSQGNCGIGYFNNNESDFPFEEGLVIRSGNVLSSAGAYTGNTNSSTCSQLGDSDLNAIVTTSGHLGNIVDVSSVKFNFTAASNLLSFNFIFASNEYGEFQCAYSDVFGFILTDLVTNVKQNIAVIPGTTTPVSITSIRNNQHNASCTSVNPDFFDSYNVNNSNSTINFKGQTVPMTAYAQLIPNRQYSLKLAVGDYQDSSYDSAVFIEGGSFAFGNQCQDNIQLVAFIDANNNGIKDTNEVNFSQGTFNYVVNDSADEIVNQSSNGILYIFPEDVTASYDFTYAIYPELASYFSTSTSFSNIVHVAGGNNIYYFPITNTQPYSDVEVTITSFQSPVPGFSYNNVITYKNNGITPVSGTLNYTYDSILMLTNITQTGTTPTTNGFTYNYTDLLPGESRVIITSFTVPTIPTVTLGQIVANTASSTNSGDVNPANNSFNFSQVIVGSYDPNDKMEAHGGKIEISDFDSNDYLFYTIRFQNTGTANAQFVRLVDDLNNQLDETSIRMISASHNYTLTRTDQNLVWKFDQINLPPEIVDEVGSNGYVQFKIKPKPGFAVGDIIPNTAEIYFDYNPAIITNTFNTEFVQLLGNTEFSQTTISLYPNPAKESFTIHNSGTETIGEISIYEISGKRIFQQTKSFETQTTIPVSNFAKGIYLVEIVSENKVKLTKKLIVE